MSSKRKDYISWETFCNALCQLIAMLSRYLPCQAGAYIETPDHRFLSYGYNGYPKYINDAILMKEGYTLGKNNFLLHAEENAILNAPSRKFLQGSTIYTTFLPCNECVKSLIQVGIRKIVYQKEYDPNDSINIASIRMIEASGIECIRMTGPMLSITDPTQSPYISLETFFMAICQLSAMRSKDPHRQIGACIVDLIKKKILSLGYNSFPKNISDDEFPWEKNQPRSEDDKFAYVVHAEKNAILNTQFSDSLEGSTVYIELFPCPECAKLIIQSGIKEIVYRSDEDHHKESAQRSRLMLDYAGISYRPYQGILLNMSIAS